MRRHLHTVTITTFGALIALFGLARESQAYVTVEGGGAGYGAGIVKVQDTASLSSCSDTCTAASSCTTSCTMREQTCSGTYVTPSSSYYAADNNAGDTYGTTYQSYSNAALSSATGEKELGDDTLVCNVAGGESVATRTCGYVGLCTQQSGALQVNQKAPLFSLACSVNSGLSKSAVSSDSATKKNKWFGFDKEVQSGTKSGKSDFTMKQKFGIAATLFKTRMELFRMDSQTAQKVDDLSNTAGDDWSKLSQLGSILSSNSPTAKTWGDSSPTDAECNALSANDAPGFSDNKKTKTKNWPVVTTAVGPVIVRVDLFVQAGFDFPFTFKLLKDTVGKYVGGYIRGTIKGYIHAGAKATASVIVASIAIKGTVNLITAALSGNLGLYSLNPTTGKSSPAHIRTYVGADFDLTTLDGTVELIIRLLWKRWKIKLANWKGLHWNWPLGGQSHAKCENLESSNIIGVSLLGSDFLNDITGGGGSCEKTNCEALGKTSGSWSDGCGGTLICGATTTTSGGGGGGGGGGGSGSGYY